MNLSNFDKTMVAATFAEAGESDTARDVLGKNTSSSPGHAPVPEKKKPFAQALIFGIISISAYILLFQNESLITETFTRGGMYTILPVGTAFLFSFVHGAFASNLLSVLGLEAKK